MNKVIEQTFSVPFRYPVCFTSRLFDPKNTLLADLLKGDKIPKAFFVIDQGVSDAHPTLISDILKYAQSHSGVFTLAADPLVVPGGEQCKNDQKSFQQVLDASNDFGIDRHSYIIAIGGGALLDMVGFAAAIAHRGIRHIRIPTTVLSQNDSGVGVKNGINAYGKKNFLGTFAPPAAVINDLAFLETLDDRDWRSGISEAIKVALIKDADFFQWIVENAPALAERDMDAMAYLIVRCAEMHMEHIAGRDPFETGSSRPLDFGHWAAHKLEHLTDYRVRHGEAVAIGIALDSTYSYLKGLLTADELDQIIQVIRDLGFDLYVPELSGEVLLQGLQEFREHLGGRLTIMLLEKIGRGVEVHAMDTELIQEAAARLKASQMEGQNVSS
ncbi:MAG: 3-dehydroquinate synthase [Lunatimonas sp.]|uniref:3-dehydroquinate synthase n=1 Tax=Lunatimonas sp. TaxID=2060141 RepID=UPI00263AA0C8|nr:3-dehydroquinate synthase [Lunatimonas sp.]MCC5937844.1 3-dehydroquinate synthase [Lunatimonas sp.]